MFVCVNDKMVHIPRYRRINLTLEKKRLKNRDVDSNKKGTAEYGVLIISHGVVFAVHMRQDVFIVQKIGYSEIEDNHTFF